MLTLDIDQNMKNLLLIVIVFNLLAFKYEDGNCKKLDRSNETLEQFLNHFVSSNKDDSLFMGFNGIRVTKMKSDSEEVIETWETTNFCTYTVDGNFTTFSFNEYEDGNVIVKEYDHAILSYSVDETTYTLVVENNLNGELYSVVFWKDGSKITLEGSDFTYLISGEYEIIQIK